MKQRKRIALSSRLLSGLANWKGTRTEFDPFQNSVVFLMTHKHIFRAHRGRSWRARMVKGSDSSFSRQAKKWSPEFPLGLMSAPSGHKHNLQGTEVLSYKCTLG